MNIEKVVVATGNKGSGSRKLHKKGEGGVPWCGFDKDKVEWKVKDINVYPEAHRDWCKNCKDNIKHGYRDGN